MPAKKKEEVTEPTAEESAEFVSKHEPAALLVSVKVGSWFSDGNLAGFFKQYGYECEWPRDQVRRIPLWLAKRAEQSGAEIEFMR